MARLFDDASSEYLRSTTSPLDGISAPYTIACWGYTDITTIAEVMLCINHSSTANNYMFISLQGTVGAARFGIRAGPDQKDADTSANFSANTWHHVAGVSTDTTNRTVYLDGGNTGTDADTQDPAFNTINIGRFERSTSDGAYFSGRVAEVGVWDVELTAAEVGVLAAGYAPPFVRPGNLLFYAPLVRTEDHDTVGGIILTPNNTPSVADHAPIIRPFRPYIITTPAAAVGLSIPVAMHEYRQRHQSMWG